MKRRWLAGLVLAGVSLALWLLLRPAEQREGSTESQGAGAVSIRDEASRGTLQSPRSSNSPAPATPPIADAVPARAQSPSPKPEAGGAPSDKKTDIAPAAVVEHTRAIITQYNAMFRENPVGTNQEITQALQGKNPRQINFLGEVSGQINANQEWVDPWGTPYFFHQLSASQMEVRSAGPDKIMWTADDVVAR